jgi:hypothetical protein
MAEMALITPMTIPFVTYIKNSDMEVENTFRIPPTPLC